MTANLSGPGLDEIELTVFGGKGGYGESCLVHVGNNRWIIVDSCLDVEAQAPAAVHRLRSYGVEPESAVVLIIVTHWHDDHIRGLSSTLESCPNAKICFSSAFAKKEFLEFVSLHNSQRDILEGSGVAEFARVFRFLKEPKNKGRNTFAIADRILLSYSDLLSTHSRNGQLISLSPADREVERFLEAIARLMPQKQPETRRRAVFPEPNEGAVVLWFQLDDVAILLGSDLEEQGHANTGWSAVLSSGARPQGRACVFKVPHHGALSAHHDGVWGQMVVPNCVSLITPYSRGRQDRMLPSAADRQRIRELTDEAYCTVMPGSRAWQCSDASVRKTVKETGARMWTPTAESGFLTVRFGPPPVRQRMLYKSGSAVRLSDIT